MSLHIGINLCPYVGGHGGAETYLRNLAAALARLRCPHRISLFISDGVQGKYTTGTDFAEIVCGQSGQSRPRRVWLEQTVLPSLVRRHRVDLVLSNYVSPIFAPCRQIVVVHDMLYKVYPVYIPSRAKLWYWRVMVAASIRRAETVLTVSQHSANDIRRFFPRDAHKVAVCVEAVPHDLAQTDSAHLDRHAVAGLGVTEPFVLCTVGLDVHKNIGTLVRAFQAVADVHPNLSLVLTDAYGRDDTAAVEGVRSVVRNRIVLPGCVSYGQLAALYRRAVAHVTPSRFEGFGLSVVEAQHFGCPGITSLAGSLPEVSGGADLYFHPDDSDQLAVHLHTVMTDDPRRRALIDRGSRNVRRYDWESTAKQFLELCERRPERRPSVPRRATASWKQRLARRIRARHSNGHIRELPLLVLMPHSRCNCRCVMCDIWKNNSQPRELSIEQIAGWRHWFDQLGVRRVMLTGGEPLMYGDLERLLRLLQDCAIQTTIATTGILLCKWARAVASHCADVVVSLDGCRPVHDAIRGVDGAFDKLADGVAAVRAVVPGFPVFGRCTIQRANIRDLPNIVEAARELHLSSISFQAVDTNTTAFNHPQGWAPDGSRAVLPTESELLELRDTVETLIRTRADDIASRFILNRPHSLRRIVGHLAASIGQGDFVAPMCNAPWISAVVEADGDVRPCFFHRVVGNVHHSALPDILNSDAMVSFRRTLSVQDDPICRRCVCPLHSSRKALASGSVLAASHSQ